MIRRTAVILTLCILTALLQSPSIGAAEETVDTKPRVEDGFLNGKDLTGWDAEGGSYLHGRSGAR